MLLMSSTLPSQVTDPSPGDGIGPGLQVFYDADCGFCVRTSRFLRRLDHRSHLELIPLHLAAETASDAPPVQVLVESIHVRDQHGQWSVGGAAMIRVASVLPMLRPLAFVGSLPIIRAVVEPTYRLIAANRHRISRLVGDDACRIEPDRP